MQQNSDTKHSVTPNEEVNKEQESRRTFMKKAAYAAPTLVALGALTRPTDAKAGVDKPPSGPEW